MLQDILYISEGIYGFQTHIEWSYEAVKSKINAS